MKAEDINWEDAPEGTTHYNFGNDMLYKFNDNTKGSYYNEFRGFEQACGFLCDYPDDEMIERPKEKEMQFKAMKIRVKDEEHSRLIQEALFEMGYGWGCYKSKECDYLSANYILTEPDGRLYFCMTEESFNKFKDPEYEAKIKVEFVEIQKPDTVELNGKTYLKSDLEEALAKLNPLEE